MHSYKYIGLYHVYGICRLPYVFFFLSTMWARVVKPLAAKIHCIISRRKRYEHLWTLNKTPHDSCDNITIWFMIITTIAWQNLCSRVKGVLKFPQQHYNWMSNKQDIGSLYPQNNEMTAILGRIESIKSTITLDWLGSIQLLDTHDSQ